MKIAVKLSQTKKDNFKKLLNILIEDGRDLTLSQEDNKITIYPKNESFCTLAFNADGTWELE